MTHEFIKILDAYKLASAQNYRTVLATIVHVDGSAYRKAGVQMLIDERLNTTGALSGGCVEKDVIRQSLNVFSSDIPRMVKYDGRYKLGCNGTIYILLEIFKPAAKLLEQFANAIEKRETFYSQSTYSRSEISNPELGTKFYFSAPNKAPKQNEAFEFEHTFTPLRRLFIAGVEHDAGKLSQIASFLGWEVIVVSSWACDSKISQFPGATHLYKVQPDKFDLNLLCNNSAMILMSHNYTRDLKTLSTIINSDLRYIGLLGPSKRKEQLINDLMMMDVIVDEYAMDKIHGPVGIRIASKTPEEIALSIMAELTLTFNKQTRAKGALNRSSPQL